MRIAFVLAGLVLALGLWQQRANRRIEGADARLLVAEGAALVDVGTAGEYATRHLPGAVHIPVDELEARAGELGPPDRPVVLYTCSGSRSARARRVLEAQGFESVHDLGCIFRW
jgi:phage shock protein E